MNKWTKRKPRLTGECLLLTATVWGANHETQFTLFDIQRVEFENKWYWGLFLDGDEYDAYEDLKADKYLMIEKP